MNKALPTQRTMPCLGSYLSHSLVVAAMQLCLMPLAIAQVVEPHWWIPDGNTLALCVDEVHETVYIGGDFKQVGPPTAFGCVVSSTSGEPQMEFARPNHAVQQALPIPGGGWFIRGYFDHVGGQSRPFVARLNEDGTVDPWAPGFNGNVQEILLSGNVLYVAGEFTQVNGVERLGLAAVDAVTGALLPFDAHVNGPVGRIRKSGNRLFLGGQFTELGGQPRQGLGAVDPISGAVGPWSPTMTGMLQSMAAEGGLIYLSGSFEEIGGATNVRLAVLDTTVGTAAPWAPTVDGYVYDMEIANGQVYMAGVFTHVNGAVRNRLASFQMTNGSLTAFDPNADLDVYDIQVDGDTVWAAGLFSTVHNQPCQHLAKVNRVTGSPFTSWYVHPTQLALCVAAAHGKVYLGGEWFTITGVAREGFAALDMNTGEPVEWAPFTTGAAILRFQLIDSLLYVAGGFFSADGQSRQNLACFNTNTRTLTNWAPTVNTTVMDMEPVDGSLIIAGNFTQVNGSTHQRLASVDASTGAVSTWHPVIDGEVNEVAVRGSRVYLGGAFHHIGGQSHDLLGAVDLVSGAPLAWNPMLSGAVDDLLVLDTTLYVGGLLQAIGGESRPGIAAFDADDGTLLPWMPLLSNIDYPESRVTQMEPSPQGTLMIGGQFDHVGNDQRAHYAELDPASGIATSWDVGPFILETNADVVDMAISGQRVFVAHGNFSVGPLVSPFFAAIGGDLTTGATPAFERRDVLKLMPNPTNGLVRLTYSGSDAQEVLVLDALGRAIMRRSFVNIIDLSGLRSGVYDVQVLGTSGLLLGRQRVVRE